MENTEQFSLENEDIEQNLVAYTVYRNTLSSLKPNNNLNISNGLTLKKKFQYDKNYQKCIPLLVKDILNLNIDEENFGKNLYAYGIQFGAAMMYGICTPKGCDFKSTKLKYTLDDGTGEINIKYNFNNNIENKKKISILRDELEMKTRALKTEKNNLQIEQNSKVNLSLRNLLRKAQENVSISELHYKAGSRIYVIGIPYKIHNEIWIHANQIDLDQCQNRNKEILYKEHLIRFYNKYSKKRKLNGNFTS